MWCSTSALPPRRRRRARRAAPPRRGRRMPSRPARARAVPVHALPRPQRQIGLESNRLTRTGRIRSVAASADQRPCRLLTAIVEDRLTDELDLDAPVEALDRAHQHVVGVVVRRRSCVGRDLVLVVVRAHRQRRADDDPAVRRLPCRLDHVGSGDVHPRRRVVDAERRQPERPGTRDRAGCRRRSASRSAARRASRSTRRARRALPCGSWRGTRSPRSA